MTSKKSKGKSKCNRSCNCNGGEAGPYGMTTREAKAQLCSGEKWGGDFHKSGPKPHLIKTLGQKVPGGRGEGSDPLKKAKAKGEYV